jgi:allantoin racemase
MRILIINPNSDAAMTAAIQQSAEAYAGGECTVMTRATPGAPTFIETYQDKLQAAPGMMRLVAEYGKEVDGFVIACHSDPNLDAVKEASTRPVVGIGEASMKVASMLGHRFSIVTTHRHSVPAKLAQVRQHHLHHVLGSVRAPGNEHAGLHGYDLFLALSRKAIDEDLAEVIVLGCAGLSGMDRRLQTALGVPVLDGVGCALILVTGLAKYGVSTSRALGYNPDYGA